MEIEIDLDFASQINKFIIPDPNDKLINIYEIDKLANLLNIRAEKNDSKEHKSHNSDASVGDNVDKDKETKIARNILNPNYSEMIELIGDIRKEKSASAINKLLTFVHKFKPHIDLNLRKGIAIPDVRCVPNNKDGLYYFFDYLFIKYVKS